MRCSEWCFALLQRGGETDASVACLVIGNFILTTSSLATVGSRYSSTAAGVEGEEKLQVNRFVPLLASAALN